MRGERLRAPNSGFDIIEQYCARTRKLTMHLHRAKRVHAHLYTFEDSMETSSSLPLFLSISIWSHFAISWWQLSRIEILYVLSIMRRVQFSIKCALRIAIYATSSGRATLYFVQLHLNGFQYFCVHQIEAKGKLRSFRQWMRKHITQLKLNSHRTKPPQCTNLIQPQQFCSSIVFFF